MAKSEYRGPPLQNKKFDELVEYYKELELKFSKLNSND